MTRGLLVPIPKVHLIWCVWEAGEQGQETAEGCGSEQRRTRNSLCLNIPFFVTCLQNPLSQDLEIKELAGNT